MNNMEFEPWADVGGFLPACFKLRKSLPEDAGAFNSGSPPIHTINLDLSFSKDISDNPQQINLKPYESSDHVSRLSIELLSIIASSLPDYSVLALSQACTRPWSLRSNRPFPPGEQLAFLDLLDRNEASRRACFICLTRHPLSYSP